MHTFRNSGCNATDKNFAVQYFLKVIQLRSPLSQSHKWPSISASFECIELNSPNFVNWSTPSKKFDCMRQRSGCCTLILTLSCRSSFGKPGRLLQTPLEFIFIKDTHPHSLYICKKFSMHPTICLQNNVKTH